MTVEEIYKDRKKFSEAVFEVASTDLVNMGITIISYTIKDIKDDMGYLRSLGMARTSQVRRWGVGIVKIILPLLLPFLLSFVSFVFLLVFLFGSFFCPQQNFQICRGL